MPSGKSILFMFCVLGWIGMVGLLLLTSVLIEGRGHARVLRSGNGSMPACEHESFWGIISCLNTWVAWREGSRVGILIRGLRLQGGVAVRLFVRGSMNTFVLSFAICLLALLFFEFEHEQSVNITKLGLVPR